MNTDTIIIILLAILVLQNTEVYKRLGGFIIFTLPGKIQKAVKRVFKK